MAQRLLVGVVLFCTALAVTDTLQGQAKLPETPAGNRVSAYVRVFNTGDEKQMEAYAQENMTTEALGRRTPDERAEMYRRMHGDMETIQIDHVSSAKGDSISVLMRTKKGESFEFNFDFEPGGEHKVNGLRVESRDAEGGAGGGPGFARGAGSTHDFASKIARVDEYVSRLASYGFAGAVLVARDGNIVFEKGYGYSNRDRKTPITTNTVFDIGSNVKDFTKLAVYQLVEAGKISMDSPLSSFFNDAPPDKANITVQQLFDHKAGFPGGIGPDPLKLTKEEFLARVFSQPLISPPGTEFHYSNPGYSILAAIIEKVSGTFYESYLADNVFKKLQLKTVGYALQPWSTDMIAHSYSNGEDRGSTFDYPHFADGTSWTLRGNGGMLSTLADMLAFYHGARAGTLVSKEHGARVAPETVMLVGGNGVHFFVYHSGAASHLEVIAASTDANYPATTLDRYLGDMFAGRIVALPPHITSVSADVLDKLVGSYRTREGASFEVAQDDGRLKLGAANQAAVAAVSGNANSDLQIDALNSKALRIVQEAEKGNYVPWRDAIGQSASLDRIKEREDRLKTDRESKLGMLRSVAVIGTYPRAGLPQTQRTTVTRPNPFVTHIREEYERGATFLQLMWEPPGTLVGIGRSESAPMLLFAPESTDTFVHFDFERGSITKIVFSHASNGAPQFAISTANGDSVTAKKEIR